MSNVKALADAEAARAEAETPDEETPETPAEPTPEEQEEEHEHEQTQEEPAEPPNIDAQMRAITSELKRHERAWAKAVGVEPEDLNTCPTCEGVGFTEQAQPVMKEADYTERCDSCNGYGDVLSGAVVERSKTVKCLACGGLGYKRLDMATPTAPNGAAEVTIEQTAPDDPDAARLRDKGWTVLPPYNVTATST